MLIWKHLLKDPHRRQRMMGSVAVTSLGVGAHFPGWIIPKSMHNLACGLGSIIKKPWVVGSEIQVREILHLTMLFDHDVIDGSPAARMIQDFVARLEKGVDFEPEVP
jgi:pyruvate/2-oxoglutarate dehydrogenase complex dihydrolipoamide acyltransferase (E2) component